MLDEDVMGLNLNASMRDRDSGGWGGLSCDRYEWGPDAEGARDRDLAADLEDAGARPRSIDAGSEASRAIIGESGDADNAGSGRSEMATTSSFGSGSESLKSGTNGQRESSSPLDGCCALSRNGLCVC